MPRSLLRPLMPVLLAGSALRDFSAMAVGQPVLFVALALSCDVGILEAQQTQQYLYDAAGQLIGVVAPDGTVTVYEYDAAGNRTRVSVGVAASVDSVTAILPSTVAPGQTTQGAITGRGLGSATQVDFGVPGIAGTIIAPACRSLNMFSRWIVESGVSRGTNTSFLPSFKQTSAALCSRLREDPEANTPIVDAEQGMITIASTG